MAAVGTDAVAARGGMRTLLSMEDRRDAELWASSIRGNGDAFGVLFDRHYSAVVARCRQLADDNQAAEDLASVTFLEAWKLRRRLNLTDEQSMRPWLFGIAINVARNANRAARRYNKFLAKLPDVAPEISAENSTLEQLASNDRVESVQRAMRALSAQQRAVLKLCDLQGRPHLDVAQQLGLSVRTVRRNLAAARAQLEAQLSNDYSLAAHQQAPTMPGGSRHD